MTECMMYLLVYTNVCETLLIVSGCDVELNPGPSKTCPKYEKSLPNRTMVCSFRYIFRIAVKSRYTSETSIETRLRMNQLSCQWQERDH